jgi:RNA-directed DNA polymerase
MSTLVTAWHAIRRNAETSRTRSTKERARTFGADLPRQLRKLQDRLRDGYSFAPAFGATPQKGPGKDEKRPIVVAPIEDRIVQRAILDVLQEANELMPIQAVLKTPTSIGGIPGRGVDHAIAMIEEAWDAGKAYAAGSDIRGFFKKIPKTRVFKFLSSSIDEPEFVDLVQRALTVELANASQLTTDDLHLFPTGPDGVAQGCPLSALAGNIVLNDFDNEMNRPERGLVCVRYIDDFIILGKSSGAVLKGMSSAKAMLRVLGMDTYDPKQSPNKAFLGKLHGQVFLGHQLVRGSYPPSSGAQDRLKASIDRLINDGQKSIQKAVTGRTVKATDRTFAATLVTINLTLKGWKGSFRSSNCPATFAEIDIWVRRRVKDFESYFRTHIKDVTADRRMLAYGLVSLSD